MTICPVCDEQLTDRSNSPHFCNEGCQEVWHAALALPLAGLRAEFPLVVMPNA